MWGDRNAPSLQTVNSFKRGRVLGDEEKLGKVFTRNEVEDLPL